METKGETRKWMHVRAPPPPHDGVGGHSSAVVRVQRRSTPPSPWHPPTLIGRRCSGGALQTQTGMCEWAQCLLWTEPRRLFVEVGGVKNKATIIHHSSGQLVRLSGNEIFWTVTESVLKPSAQKARNHFCVFYIYFFLRMDGEAQVDGRRRRWGAAVVKFFQRWVEALFGATSQRVKPGTK